MKNMRDMSEESHILNIRVSPITKLDKRAKMSPLLSVNETAGPGYVALSLFPDWMGPTANTGVRDSHKIIVSARHLPSGFDTFCSLRPSSFPLRVLPLLTPHCLT